MPEVDVIEHRKRLRVILAVGDTYEKNYMPEFVYLLQKRLKNYDLSIRIVSLEEDIQNLTIDLPIVTNKSIIGKKRRNIFVENKILWADILIIVPMGPYTLYSIFTEKSDNLIKKLILNWPSTKPALFFPAMLKRIWTMSSTQECVFALEDQGYIFIRHKNKINYLGRKGFMIRMSIITHEIQDFIDNMKDKLLDSVFYYKCNIEDKKLS